MSVNTYNLLFPLKGIKIFDDYSNKITALSTTGQYDLFIGSNKGLIYHHKFETIEDEGIPSIFYEKISQRSIGKGPVICMKSASFMNLLFVQCDDILSSYSIPSLEPVLLSHKIKSVSCFHIQEGQTRDQKCITQLCIGTKQKIVHMFTVEADKLQPISEISVSDIPRRLTFSGGLVCVAFSKVYNLINLKNNQTTELFEFGNEPVKPLLVHVGKDEFLVNGPGALGIFANIDGASQRPPIQWSQNLIDVIYQKPYILALNDEFLTVHSLSDQEQKQSFPLSEGSCMCRGSNFVLVGRRQDVYLFARQPWEKQAQELLDENRVEEALKLAEIERHMAGTLANEKAFIKKFRHVLVAAGFVYFKNAKLKEAQSYFEQGCLDIRELLCVYSELLPSGYNFRVPDHVPQKLVQEMCQNNQELYLHYRLFLLNFLEEHRESKLALPYKEIVETVLLKLYAELKPHDINLFIFTMGAVDVEDVIAYLIKRNCQHAAAMLYHWQHNDYKALEIWRKIVDGELSDATFPGVKFLVEILVNLEQHDLVFQYAEWLLRIDEELGVRIFMDRPNDETPSDKMKVEHIVDYLHNFPAALTRYLEHIIFVKKDKNTNHHTLLARLYLEKVVEIRAGSDESASREEELLSVRKRFQHFIEESDLYRVQHLLSKVKEIGDLGMETAILYGKLGDHKEALNIIVYELTDFDAAEWYCARIGRAKSLVERQKLYETLLRVYLDTDQKNYQIRSTAAIRLLNSLSADFDYITVIKLLPDDWSVGILCNFLTRALRQSLHESRMTCLAKGLSASLSNQSRLELLRQTGRSTAVYIDDHKLCSVCRRPFQESSAARLQSGEIVHPRCAPLENIY